jgi:hypothetical protein
MSPVEHLPQAYDDLRKLAAAGMPHEAAGQPHVNVHFADESNSPQPASVGTTAARNAGPPVCGGHIDRGNRRPLRCRNTCGFFPNCFAI